MWLAALRIIREVVRMETIGFSKTLIIRLHDVTTQKATHDSFSAE
jgi:hypothetical protein